MLGYKSISFLTCLSYTYFNSPYYRPANICPHKFIWECNAKNGMKKFYLEPEKYYCKYSNKIIPEILPTSYGQLYIRLPIRFFAKKNVTGTVFEFLFPKKQASINIILSITYQLRHIALHKCIFWYSNDKQFYYTLLCSELSHVFPIGSIRCPLLSDLSCWWHILLGSPTQVVVHVYWFYKVARGNDNNSFFKCSSSMAMDRF